MFDYDWFFGTAYQEQCEHACLRLAQRKHPEVDFTNGTTNGQAGGVLEALECRTLLYLRDGFSYEIKELIGDVRSKSHLTFECEPADDLYKVGAFIVSVPFEDVARVEVFAAHRDERPENLPSITGFRNGPPRHASEPELEGM